MTRHAAFATNQPLCHSVTPPTPGDTTLELPEFIRRKIPVKQKSSEIAPLLFTVYLAAASGRSPALPCFAAFSFGTFFGIIRVYTVLFSDPKGVKIT